MAAAGIPTIEKKSPISTHILDTTKGLPVASVPVSLYKLINEKWTFINASETNTDGRCGNILENGSPHFTVGRYKMCFEVENYFVTTNTPALYPIVEIVFDIKNSLERYHLPLLLNPFGYSTYRGS